MKIRRALAAMVGAALAAAVLAVVPGGVAHADTVWESIDAWQGTDLKCLDVRKQDDYYRAGARIQIWDCSGALEQQWMWHPYPEQTPPQGEFGIRSTLYQVKSLRSGMCMEVRNGDTITFDRQVDQMPCGSGSIDSISQQLWLRGPMDDEGRVSLSPWSAVRANVSRCLDIVGGSTDNGSMLQQYPCTYNWNQRFATAINGL